MNKIYDNDTTVVTSVRGRRELAAMETQSGLLARRGQLVEAAEVRRDIVRILLDISTPTTPSLLPHFRELRRYYKKMGMSPKAEDAAVSALRISEMAPITRGGDLALDLLELGRLQAAVGRWDHALGNLGRGLKVTRIVHGEGSPEMADAHLSWGDGYFESARFAEAREQFERALQILRTGPAQSDAMAEAHAHMGRLCLAESRWTEAENHLTLATEARAGAFGPHDPATAGDRLRLAAFYIGRGRLDEAYNAMQRAMEIRQAHLERVHPLVAEAACVWADIESARNRASEAESLYQNACLVFEGAYGGQSPDLAGALHNLASLYHHHGHYDEAEKHLRRAQTIYSKALGPAHRETAAVAENLATIAAARLRGYKGKAG